jgi:hypothetical protein
MTFAAVQFTAPRSLTPPSAEPDVLHLKDRVPCVNYKSARNRLSIFVAQRAVKIPAVIFLHPPVTQFQQRFLTEKFVGIR